MDAACTNCLTPGAALQCGKCRNAVYCNRTCQAADWRAGHRYVCRGPSAPRPEDDDLVQEALEAVDVDEPEIRTDADNLGPLIRKTPLRRHDAVIKEALAEDPCESDKEASSEDEPPGYTPSWRPAGGARSTAEGSPDAVRTSASRGASRERSVASKTAWDSEALPGPSLARSLQEEGSEESRPLADAHGCPPSGLAMTHGHSTDALQGPRVVDPAQGYPTCGLAAAAEPHLPDVPDALAGAPHPFSLNDGSSEAAMLVAGAQGRDLPEPLVVEEDWAEPPPDALDPGLADECQAEQPEGGDVVQRFVLDPEFDYDHCPLSVPEYPYSLKGPLGQVPSGRWGAAPA